MTEYLLLFAGYPIIAVTVDTDTQFSQVPFSLQQFLQQIWSSDWTILDHVDYNENELHFISVFPFALCNGQ